MESQSILKMNYDTRHPLAFGMEEESIAFFSRARVFEMISDTVEARPKKQETENPDKKEKDKSKRKIQYAKVTPKIVASHPDEPLLISGWVLGEEVIQGKPAILDVPYGKGKIALFGFNVHNRAQAHATFKLLFNALYY